MRTNRLSAVVAGAAASALMASGVALQATTAHADPVVTPSEPTIEVAKSPTGSYIVVTKADPLVVTEGRDNLATAKADRKGRQKRAEHVELLREVGVEAEQKTVDYVYAVDGFAARMSHREAVKLASHKDVALVLPDELYQPMTDASPEFLGLTTKSGKPHWPGRPGKPWKPWDAKQSKDFDKGKGKYDRRRAPGPWDLGIKGQRVVVGVIDSGIWPEHPSFADRGFPEPDIAPLEDVTVPGPDGQPYTIEACDFGNTAHNPDDAPFECNNKLVGARQVLPTYRTLTGAIDEEFDSARDDNGHGTHTASTAAGNSRVRATVLGHDLGKISGMAPNAHIIAYKGLGDLGGYGSDLALAVDLAVFDGVDVINYSIGGGGTTLTAEELAFLFAADAGVHVATSAGNSGPGASTLGNPAKAPWLTTVGANTQDRFIQGTLELGDGREFVGASVTGEVGPAPIVDAADHGHELCIPGNLATGAHEGHELTGVEGKIVLCKRGEIGRVDKSRAVLEAGGVGMVLYEASDAGDLFTDSHFVPTVHIDNTPGIAIKEYIAEEGADATAEIRDTGEKGVWPYAPNMVSFSSRGPNPWPDVIKPDITAPGLQILAGYSPKSIGGVDGELFAAIAGTSMSSPHIAGILALVDQAHPDWSPAMARSALMTTADDDVLDNDRTSRATPFAQGSGLVDVGSPVKKGSAFQPGLVYDAGLNDYFGFLCDVQPGIFTDPAATCGQLAEAGVPTDARNLNYPSIAVDQVASEVTVTRTVTSVARGWKHYRADIDAPEGYEVEVSPRSFWIKKGQTRTFEVTVRNVSGVPDQWAFGDITWKSWSGYKVRSPLAVSGAVIDVADSVSVTGTEGSSSLEVGFGYEGPYTATAHGFAADTGQSGNVVQDPDQTCQCNGTGGPGEVAHTLDLSGTQHLRIAMDTSDLGPGGENTDIDLFLYRDGVPVASSTAGGTTEVIDLPTPEDGTYTLWVHGWAAPAAGVDYRFHLWDVREATSLSVDSAPTSASPGTSGTVEFSWSGLEAGQTYLGGIRHDTGGEVPPFLTLVEATP